MACGRVIQYFQKNGYGFIIPEGGGERIHFEGKNRIDAVDPKRMPQERDRVTFTLATRNVGYCAPTWAFMDDRKNKELGPSIPIRNPRRHARRS